MGTRTSCRASGAVGGNASGAMCQGRRRTNDLRTGQGSGPAEARFTRRSSRKGVTCGSHDKPVGMLSREPFSQAGTTTRHLRWLAVPQTACHPYPQRPVLVPESVLGPEGPIVHEFDHDDLAHDMPLTRTQAQRQVPNRDKTPSYEVTKSEHLSIGL